MHVTEKEDETAVVLLTSLGVPRNFYPVSGDAELDSKIS